MPETEQDTAPNTDQGTGGSVIQTELQLMIVPPGGKVTGSVHPFTLTGSGIVIPESLTLEEWKEGLKLFKWAQTSLKLGFAGYISFGKAKFGKEVVDDALGQLEFEMPEVKQALDIGTVPDEMRHENLTAEHYIVLARADDLSKPKKVKWAKIAAEQNLTPPQLKASIAAGEVVSVDVARQQRHGIISIHGIRQEVDIWLNRVKGIDGILKMDDAHRQEILDLLKPIHDLYAAIKAGPKKKGKKAAKKKS